ncbi:MAG TPA: hypothetical protein VGN57_17770 [Pirellulaceae bacterium]|jgi:predicted MFS family arabinose efflux permease|nr:hypothetical protein [Pirellulaceae bacterium]
MPNPYSAPRFHAGEADASNSAPPRPKTRWIALLVIAIAVLGMTGAFTLLEYVRPVVEVDPQP